MLRYIAGLFLLCVFSTQCVFALNSCSDFGPPGVVGSHVQLISLEYRIPGEDEFTSVSSDGPLCVRFYTIMAGSFDILGVQILNHGNRLEPEYPRGTTFRVKIKWDDNSKVFGAVVYRASNGRAYRADEDGVSTLSMQVESMHIVYSGSTLDQCTAGKSLEYESAVEAMVYLRDRAEASPTLGFDGGDRLVASLRAENFINPSLTQDGALNFYLDACNQGEAEPDLFLTGFLPRETIDSVGISSAQLEILSDQQIQMAFSVRAGSADISQIAASFRKSFGEEISSDGSALSETMQGIHFEVSAYKSTQLQAFASIIYRESKLAAGQTLIGLKSNSKRALKDCLKKNGRKKAGKKLVTRNGALICRGKPAK